MGCPRAIKIRDPVVSYRTCTTELRDPPHIEERVHKASHSAQSHSAQRSAGVPPCCLQGMHFPRAVCAFFIFLALLVCLYSVSGDANKCDDDDSSKRLDHDDSSTCLGLRHGSYGAPARGSGGRPSSDIQAEARHGQPELGPHCTRILVAPESSIRTSKESIFATISPACLLSVPLSKPACASVARHSVVSSTGFSPSPSPLNRGHLCTYFSASVSVR